MHENRGGEGKEKKKSTRKPIIDRGTSLHALPKNNGVFEAVAHALHVLVVFFLINILYLLKDKIFPDSI
jgi:hypothetical protein